VLYNRLKPWVAVFLVIAMIIFMTTSCYAPKLVIDSDSGTPGYKLFKGTKKGFRISFEYPNTWDRVTVDRVGTGSYMPLLPPDCSVIISSDVGSSQIALQFQLDLISKHREFSLISRDNVTLGQAEGEEIICSYLFPGQDPHLPGAYVDTGETVINRILSVDYKGYYYYIELIASLNAYDIEKTGFEHMLSTFRFLN
jgi:hypothetical protein